jgi:membrane complex biogenesis BtpA family protein
MVHLGPLPGAARFDGGLDEVADRAVGDAATLANAVFDAVLIENYGDAPFFADDVPKTTVAAMTRIVVEVTRSVKIPIGVNVLRNDAFAALAVAAATGAAFIRVNVLAGSMFTDQGPIVGKAAEIARLRSSLGADVEVAADVMVKHAVPPPGWSLEQAARDTWERAGADALIVSGSGTGAPVSEADLSTVKAAAPGAPLFVGSGVTAETAVDLLRLADGLIVGTAIKRDGITEAPVDPERAAALVHSTRAG